LRPHVHFFKLSEPSNYGGIFRFADEVLRDIISLPRTDDLELCMHLYPGGLQDAGSPVSMAAASAIWLMLGKTRYHPATFYQTDGPGVRVADIPFDLIEEYGRDILRSAAANFPDLDPRRLDPIAGFEGIAGSSRSIRDAIGRARKAVRRGVPVLIVGESGAGKQMFARAIHGESNRGEQPFVAVNCDSGSRETLQSELFGLDNWTYPGALRATDGGTLFLDHVDECDPDTQAWLLNALGTAHEATCRVVFRRPGNTMPTESDVRIIAGTSRDPPALIAENSFRSDLYHRLAVITIKLPPLRDRREDIPAIVEALMGRINRSFEGGGSGAGHKKLSRSAMKFVREHAWPGNVRQLFGTLRQAAVLADSDVIEGRDVAHSIVEVPAKAVVDLKELPLGDGFSVDKLLDEIHRHYLLRALEEGGGMLNRMSKLLGVDNYQTQAARLKRYGIERVSHEHGR
jgi:DNA-binding NtrC family response regulator